MEACSLYLTENSTGFSVVKSPNIIFSNIKCLLIISLCETNGWLMCCVTSVFPAEHSRQVEVRLRSCLPPQVTNLLCNSDFSNQTLESERISDSLAEKEQNELNIEAG